jgi:phosphoribosylamine--glycine ligase
MQKLKILLIGSGGRESAIAIAIQKQINSQKPDASVFIEDFFVAPGNPQIASFAKCIKINLSNELIVDFCKQNHINLVIVGPEDPLANGICDALQKAGIKAFGPSAAAAKLESSKIFMKDFCLKYNIPTAKYKTFTSQNTTEEVLSFATQIGYPIVLKTDGLAAGKGVVICEDEGTFCKNLEEYFNGKFGKASKSIVVEEFLTGKEVSFFALSDGKNFKTFFYACDHKKLLDNNQGPNTGGMGTYSFKSILNEASIKEAENLVIKPLVGGMLELSTPYKGVIFAGLMLTQKGIRLIEYNVRFGDPETQAMLPLLQNDITDIFLAVTDGTLDKLELKFSDDACINVVCVSGWYPDAYKKDILIKGLQNIEASQAEVIHCGTALNAKGELVTAGGRVLSLRAVGNSIAEARVKAYNQIEKIEFEGCYYRKDIAKNL